MKLTVYYQTITPESAQHGDYDETGLEEIRDDFESLQDLADYIKMHYGYLEPNVYPIEHLNNESWFSTTDPIHDNDYYTKGIEQYYTLHFDNVDVNALWSLLN